MIKLICFLVIGLFASSLAKASGGEAPATPADPEQQKYQALMTKLNDYRAKTLTFQNEIRTLIAAKRKAKDREELDAAMKALSKTYEDLRAHILKYNETLDEALYRFPAQGKEIKNEYKAIKIDSLDNEVKEAGVDLKLTELRDQLDKVYEPLPSKEDPRVREKPVNLFPTTTLPRREVYEF